MKPPPRDGSGTIPHDHAEILDDDSLVRYVRAEIHAFYEDGAWRVSSAAFSPSKPPNDPRSSVSVDSESLMLNDGLEEPFRTPDDSFGSVRVAVKKVRAENLQVGWDPIENNPYHCGIWGILNNQSKRKRLAKAAEFIKYPKN
jgi:hypothetical protein